MMAQRENLQLVVNMMLGIQVLSSDSENSNNHSHAYQKPSKKVNELYYGWEIIRETRPFIVLSSRTFSVFALTLKSSAPFTFFFLLIFFNVHPTRSYFKLLITSLHVFYIYSDDLGTGSNPEKNKICEIFLSINMLFERGYWQFDRKKVYIAQRKLFMPAKASSQKKKHCR